MGSLGTSGVKCPEPQRLLPRGKAAQNKYGQQQENMCESLRKRDTKAKSWDDDVCPNNKMEFHLLPMMHSFLLSPFLSAFSSLSLALSLSAFLPLFLCFYRQILKRMLTWRVKQVSSSPWHLGLVKSHPLAVPLISFPSWVERAYSLLQRSQLTLFPRTQQDRSPVGLGGGEAGVLVSAWLAQFPATSTYLRQKGMGARPASLDSLARMDSCSVLRILRVPPAWKSCRFVTIQCSQQALRNSLCLP